MTNHINIAVIITSAVLLVVDSIEKLSRDAFFYVEGIDKESGFGYRFVLSMILAIVNLNFAANSFQRLSKFLLIVGTPYIYLILPLQVGPVYSELYLWYPYAIIPFIVLPAMVFDYEEDLWLQVVCISIFLLLPLFSKELLDYFAADQIEIQHIILDNHVFYRVAPTSICVFAIICIYYLIVLNDKNAGKLDAKNKSLSKTLEELNQTQDQLIKNEKMAVIGRMSSELTHEINTPISAIKANLSMLAYDQRHRLHLLKKIGLGSSEEELDQLSALLKDMHETARGRPESLNTSDSDLAEMTDQIENSGAPKKYSKQWSQCLIEIGIKDPAFYNQLYGSELSPELIDFISGEYQQRHSFKVSRHAIAQAEKLVNKLKSLAYSQKLDQVTTFKLENIVHSSMDLLESQMKSVDFQFTVVEGLGEILGQSDEVLQVVNNLILNALQAMNFSGSLLIEVCGDDHSQQVIIEDSGGGIMIPDDEDIFEAFFTTKPKGEGTGLGLHICKQIIEKHHGTIKWENTSLGAKFTVTLPLSVNV